MTAHVSGLSFSLDPLMAEAKRRMRKRRVLVAVLALLVVGAAAGAAVVMTSSSAVQLAGACPTTAGGYYAYAVPQDPAHPPAASSGATSWGWKPIGHQVKVGDRMLVSGRVWQVTGIAAMPGVEPVGRPFSILGWQPPLLNGPASGGPRPQASLTFCGRLMFRPVG
jgi:hypothetical protein